MTHTNGERRDYEEIILRNNWCGSTDSSQGQIGIIQALSWFYGAPVTKFCTNLVRSQSLSINKIASRKHCKNIYIKKSLKWPPINCILDV